jgi:transcriptional regulator with XRE-family HTH domain
MANDPWNTRNVKFRHELKRIRKTANLSQVELSKMFDKPQSFISKVENGERKLDWFETIEYCRYCEADPAELLQHSLALLKVK